MSTTPTMTGPLNIDGDLEVANEASAGVVRATRSGIAAAQASTAYLEFATPLNKTRLVATGPNPATVGGGFLFDGLSSDFSLYQGYMNLDPGGSTIHTDLDVEGDLMADGANVTTLTTGSVNADTAVIATASVNELTAADTITTDTITANAATFDAATVQNSPVRTFANTPDGEGPSYPPPGIGVSTGTSWDDDSIDPASLATWPAAGIPVSTGTAWGAPLDPITAFVPQKLTQNVNLDTTGYSLTIGNTAAAATAGNGANGVFNLFAAGKGQATTGTTGQTGGNGDVVVVSGGDAGAAPAGSTNGNGGNANLTGGRAGTGAGIAGKAGDVLIAQSWGNTYIGGNSAANGVQISQGGKLQAAGSLTTTFNSSAANPAGEPGISAGLKMIWNLQSGIGETGFINYRGGGGGGFSWYNVASNATVVGGTTAPAMYLDSSNGLHVAGAGFIQNALQMGDGTTTLVGDVASIRASTVTKNLILNAGSTGKLYLNFDTGNGGVAFCNGAQVTGAQVGPGGGIQSFGAITTPTVTQSQVNMGLWSGTPALQLINGSGAANAKYSDIITTPTGIQFRFADDAIASANSWLTVSRSGLTPTVAQFRCPTVVTGGGVPPAAAAAPTYSLLMQTNSFATYLIGTGDSSGPGQIHIGGIAPNSTAYADFATFFQWAIDLYAPTTIHGTFTATGAKNFRIVHPLDNTKYLTHSCIEGPETVVFYRGEGQTDANAIATITLPDYFEALTRPEKRTVQLTEIFEDDETELGKLAASRVLDGKFKVRSEYANQKFYWEVKAVRADIDELAVETDIPVDDSWHPDYEAPEQTPAPEQEEIESKPAPQKGE